MNQADPGRNVGRTPGESLGCIPAEMWGGSLGGSSGCIPATVWGKSQGKVWAASRPKRGADSRGIFGLNPGQNVGLIPAKTWGGSQPKWGGTRGRRQTCGRIEGAENMRKTQPASRPSGGMVPGANIRLAYGFGNRIEDLGPGEPLRGLPLFGTCPYITLGSTGLCRVSWLSLSRTPGIPKGQSFPPACLQLGYAFPRHGGSCAHLWEHQKHRGRNLHCTITGPANAE